MAVTLACHRLFGKPDQVQVEEKPLTLLPAKHFFPLSTKHVDNFVGKLSASILTRLQVKAFFHRSKSDHPIFFFLIINISIT
jgi:hypothetical protein